MLPLSRKESDDELSDKTKKVAGVLTDGGKRDPLRMSRHSKGHSGQAERISLLMKGHLVAGSCADRWMFVNSAPVDGGRRKEEGGKKSRKSKVPLSSFFPSNL